MLLLFGKTMLATEKEVNMNDLKPITFENSIDILFVEENYSEIKDLMETYENKESFYYNYIMGKLFYEEGIKETALKFLKNALEYDENNAKLRMDLLKIYLTDKNYKNEVEKNIDFLEKQNLSEKEMLLLSELKKIYLESIKIKSTNLIEVGLVYDDNINFNTDKDSEFYNTNNLIYYGLKDLTKGTLKMQGSIGAKTPYNSIGKTGISLSGGGEYSNIYKKISYSVPAYLNFESINANELKFSTGLNYKKEILGDKNLNAGFGVIAIINNNYSGFDLSLNGNYKFKKSINYSLDTKLVFGFYDEETYEKNSFLVSLNTDMVLKNKYYLYGKYTYEFVDSSFTVQGKKRKDIINTLKIGYEQNIFKEDLKFGANYTYSYDLPNYDDYESSKNLLNTSVKWEF